jgi:hypothetical protein
MTRADERPHWAPRVPRQLIKRLYESDAEGRLDDELLDDVGIRLHLRCQSILTVRGIQQDGLAPCARCGLDVPCRDLSILVCSACGWSLPWTDYWATFRHNELAYDAFVSDFISDWDAARTSRVKMLAIDRVIHRWHNDTKQKRPNFLVGRPAGVNLIEGSRQQVIAFLDELTSSGEIRSPNAAEWRHQLDEVRQQQTR